MRISDCSSDVCSSDLLCGRALAVEAGADVFPGADRDPLLARARGNADLRFRDVELGHHSGPDVADLQRQRHPDLFVLDSMIAMHPYYVARAIGGLLFLIGAIVGCYNIWMTIRRPSGAPALSGDAPLTANLQPAE